MRRGSKSIKKNKRRKTKEKIEQNSKNKNREISIRERASLKVDKYIRRKT